MLFAQSMAENKCVCACLRVWPPPLLLLVCGGCPQYLLTSMLPAELNYVSAHRDAFSQSDTDPLADVTAGEVIDDLTAANLDGCWGAFDVFRSQSGAKVLEDFEVYQFDATNGTARWFVLQRTAGGIVSVPVVTTGAFSIVSENQIHVDVQNRTVLGIGLDALASEPNTPLAPLDMFITISGDRLKVGDGSAVADQRDELVIQRFDCSQ